MGDAPTVPGISARFSIPPRPLLMAYKTSSCHTSPAATRSHTWLSSSRSMVMPFSLLCTTRPSTGFVRSMLLPPPRICFCCGISVIAARSLTSWSSVKYAADTSMPKVLYGLREIFCCSSIIFFQASPDQIYHIYFSRRVTLNFVSVPIKSNG